MFLSKHGRESEIKWMLRSWDEEKAQYAMVTNAWACRIFEDPSAEKKGVLRCTASL